jgi:hypothetical protein
MSNENRSGIGQHRGDGQGALNSGQRQRRDPAAQVGNLSGGEMNNVRVPASRRDADISSTTKSAGPLTKSERRGGSDDRR